MAQLTAPHRRINDGQELHHETGLDWTGVPILPLGVSPVVPIRVPRATVSVSNANLATAYPAPRIT
jgi:hypothetical protein